jgi:hypothetical protein
MKTYLETYWTASNVTLDDGVTSAQWVVMYGRPLVDIHEFLVNMSVDVLLTVEEGEPARALIDVDQVPYGYEQRLPIRGWCIDKYTAAWAQTITGTILKGKVEMELRNILETYPTGSQYTAEESRSVDRELGGERVYGVEFIVSYRRSVTA